MTIYQLAFAGDSLTHGAAGGFNIPNGGQGSWVDLVAERLANINGLGPLLSSGIRGTWSGYLATNPYDWTFAPSAASWTADVSTDAWDKAPYGGTTTVTGSRYANGATKIATFTKTRYERANVGFALYWLDYTNGGAWSYRIDGGAWTAMGQTVQNNNAIKKFYVATPIVSTLDIRCATAAGSDVGCHPLGIELFYSTATSGLIVHNVAIGGSALHELCLTTSGDRLAWFDSVILGTGSPITNTPNAGVVNMNINDVARASTSDWNTDLTTLNTRVSPLGPVGFINPYGCNTASYSSANQDSYRSQTKTTAAGFAAPAKVLDLFDAWNGNGWGSTNAAQYAAAITDARLNADGTHEAQLGHYDLANRIYWWVRNNFFSAFPSSVPSTYTAKAKQAAVQYAAKAAAVQYAACAPIGVG